MKQSPDSPQRGTSFTFDFKHIATFITIMICIVVIAIAITQQVTQVEPKPLPRENIAQLLHLGYYDLTEDETEVYALMFSKYAKKYDIDWKIYPAIITIESNWQPSSVSDSGAIGTMQVMKNTFREECNRYNIPYQRNKTIYNDIILLRVGLEYLSRMIVKYGLDKGVKSYVGGPAHHPACKDCSIYLTKFKAEYAKIIRLEKEYKRIEELILKKTLSQ